jgi:four helix bundle protein
MWYSLAMHDYTRLRVWQRAQQLALDISRDTEALDERVYPGVATELRGAVTGIATHVAEGSREPTPALFAKSLMQSIACATAVQKQLHAAHTRGIIDHPRHVMLDLETQEIRRMLYALRARIFERINAKKTKQ